jgi:translation initiation factor 1
MARQKKMVFSTDPNYDPLCNECLNKQSLCTCKDDVPQTGKDNRPVEIRRETKGRAGKAVTVIRNAFGDTKAIQKDLQKLCGVGGTMKNGAIELQGDQRQKVEQYFKGKGRKVKFTGG